MPFATQGVYSIDEQGIIHLVDNPDSIPAEYREQVKVYRDTGAATRARIVNNQVLVPVTLSNGAQEVQATLVLDTGCTVTSISEELAARLQIDPNRTRPGTAGVADGRSIPTRRASIDQLSAGPKTKAPLEVSIMPVAGAGVMADGLLGMNFLRDFRYQLDMAGQQIHWR
ncbi:MAG: retroviral-like aspartic protease family protein [Geobacteraceae bacterium]|nr:retroviral-like aspartic protease family protein [Geobacteraceae bacterium]